MSGRHYNKCCCNETSLSPIKQRFVSELDQYYSIMKFEIAQFDIEVSNQYRINYIRIKYISLLRIFIF